MQTDSCDLFINSLYIRNMFNMITQILNLHVLCTLINWFNMFKYCVLLIVLYFVMSLMYLSVLFKYMYVSVYIFYNMDRVYLILVQMSLNLCGVYKFLYTSSYIRIFHIHYYYVCNILLCVQIYRV